MMSPILSLAVAGLRGKDMAQAIGLANMIRQLGGAVGIALINVFLIHKNAELRGSLIGYVTDYSGAATDRISGLAQTFMSKGYSAEQAQTMAYQTMEGMVFKQQALVSYDQGFFAVGILILICIPVVFLIRYKKNAKAAVISDH